MQWIRELISNCFDTLHGVHPAVRHWAFCCFQVAKLQQAALAEDPSIFDYDSHFDSIQEQREGPKQAERQARKSRYIEGLLDKAKERQKEQDIVYERRSVSRPWQTKPLLRLIAFCFLFAAKGSRHAGLNHSVNRRHKWNCIFNLLLDTI